MLTYVYSCICDYIADDPCTQLLADANVRIQLYIRVYNCVNMLMCVKRCMYLIIHVYSCLQMLTYVYSCICEYIAVHLC